MATFTNNIKTSSTFINDIKFKSSLTWNEATFTWDEATELTWDESGWSNNAKSSSAFTNDVKN